MERGGVLVPASQSYVKYIASTYSVEGAMDDPSQLWSQPSVVEWSQLLMNS